MGFRVFTTNPAHCINCTHLARLPAVLQQLVEPGIKLESGQTKETGQPIMQNSRPRGASGRTYPGNGLANKVGAEHGVLRHQLLPFRTRAHTTNAAVRIMNHAVSRGEAP